MEIRNLVTRVLSEILGKGYHLASIRSVHSLTVRHGVETLETTPPLLGEAQWRLRLTRLAEHACTLPSRPFVMYAVLSTPCPAR